MLCDRGVLCQSGDVSRIYNCCEVERHEEGEQSAPDARPPPNLLRRYKVRRSQTTGTMIAPTTNGSCIHESKEPPAPSCDIKPPRKYEATGGGMHRAATAVLRMRHSGAAQHRGCGLAWTASSRG